MENKTPATRAEILRVAAETFGTQPEYLWQDTPSYAVLRHTEGRRWYAVLMTVPRARLGLPGAGAADILNVKCDPALAGSLRLNPGILPAYHMNKDTWLSVLLDGTVERGMALDLLAMSYRLTAPAPRRPKPKPAAGPAVWVAPANPGYFDVAAAFAADPVLLWKQTARVAAGDIVYLYMAAPVAAVLYRCRVLEADIPLEHEGRVRIRRAMRLRLLHTYAPDAFPMPKLRELGLTAVRSQRHVPPRLARALAEAAEH